MVLRNLRSRLDLDRALATGDDGPWALPLRECTADVDAYDQALVSAAAMLDVAVPPPAPGPRRFDIDQRRRLEAALEAAGVELTSPGEIRP